MEESIGKWRLISPFFIILLLHCIAILLFTRGFLLTRTELSTFSACSDITNSPCYNPNFNLTEDQNQNDSRVCWTKPAVDRVVIIVLDALRFDFLASSSLFEGEKKPWMDKLQVLQNLASDEKSSAKIFKALADPPTTSLQRLKGLTTGGLPTFVDVGNSFGAPAIIEDNLIHQLVQNGKRVLMMGDDTWVQLFPDQFGKSYPYPSFNVKDLHTVDDGCVHHLIPSLYEEDWDVLIAHFLGVDHAGHIFGVDSTPMIEKLEQYNGILEKVIEALKNQSGPGGLHENTFFIVMGDHGQTLNGDHGGGTAEEVETSLFAMSLKNPPASIPSALDTASCVLDSNGKKVCASTIQQLDFAATVTALLGVPFPYGSIGRVNPELYGLSSGTWNGPVLSASDHKQWSDLEKWMQNYANVLCINSWQVKRYIDAYSAASVIGFSLEDLRHVADMYDQAQNNWSRKSGNFSLCGNEIPNESCDASLTVLQGKIDAFSNFLASVAELARSKWTEFDLKMMGVGLGIFVLSLFVHIIAIRRSDKLCQISCPSDGDWHISLRVISAIFLVAIRACSFLSNSYILTEGKVASFLLGTTGILNLRSSIVKKETSIEAVAFLLLNFFLRFTTEVGLSKQEGLSAFMNLYPLRMLAIDHGHPVLTFVSDIVPMLVLILLSYLLLKSTADNHCRVVLKYVFNTGAILSYMLIALHWALESNMLTLPLVLKHVDRDYLPRLIYAIGLGLLALSALTNFFKEEMSNYTESVLTKTISMLSACSSTVILLLGRQGPFIALACIIGGWCITRLGLLEVKTKHGIVGVFTADPLPVTQWSLFAVCLFFSTGHWCAFDGLRYGAAFIGFDEFNLIRQAILLTIDTFGVSLILPILGLPLLVVLQYPYSQGSGGTQGRGIFFVKLSQVFLMYGFITATTTMVTIICVTLQRRHLMVWGLFAPKFVFDVVGLLLTDFIICLTSLYHFCRVEDGTK
ncbi:hypothetical protein MKW94_014917 [Papaver nudicaule]|uniref:GPI ethanolamine phosphate transferase 2 C-terminal domain-containing protein n=1 Tax=Papaver nudicaule TaxID=74823 RepID=A0AA41SHY6_PAPNU|nr:hypothetical protein [Papaver nudicaule]